MISLKDRNPHPRDSRIVFDEEPHLYYIDGKQTKTSVTSVIHNFFPHFDVEKVAVMTQRKNYNTRSSKYFQLSVDEIKQMWEDNRNEAATAGTHLHKSIENYYNDIPPDNSSQEFKYFLNFVDDFKGLVPYRTEWEIYDEDLNIAGSIDMLFENPDGTLDMYDWKRSKQIVESNSFQKGKGPVSHMDHCNLSHYTLQLNIYKYILETKYDKTISSMALVVCHPDNNNYLRFEIPDMAEKVTELLDAFMLTN